MDSSGPPDTGITLTDVLALDRLVSLYGRRINDLAPRGDLGLGLDPEGPVGFAQVRGYRRQGEFVRLREPLVLSVFGDGSLPAAGDADALPGERIWRVALADRGLGLVLHCGSFAALLAEEPGTPAAARP